MYALAARQGVRVDLPWTGDCDQPPVNRFHEGFVLGDRYTLTARIASGGMGDVWEASDGVLERQVAVKILRPSLDEEEVFARRFRNEALHTANLAHFNIATVFDYGEEG